MELDLIRSADPEVAEAIEKEHPDLLYSDEDMITENGKRHMDPHRKPGFQPETTCNYQSMC